jgi:3D (Asp-Asp-Asp) domain-containing protein
VFNESRGSQLEFRAEAYNIWNHTQLRADVQSGNYGNSMTGSNFGVITQAYDPRVFQLGLKLTF